MAEAGLPECAEMLGRQREWQAVLDLLQRTGSGGNGALLIEGEPGMGKTLLLAEAARQARAAGFSLVQGAADELSRLLPLAPLLAALGEPTGLVTGSGDSAGAPDGTAWLIEALRRRLEQRATAGPTLVSLDDLQWSDPATLMALRTLPSQLASLPLAWLLARRIPDEANEAGRLFGLLEREGAGRMGLGALDASAVAALITRKLAAVPEPRLTTLAAGAAGNPAMLVELIGGLLEEEAVTVARGRADLASARVPRRTRAVARSWISGLSPRARQLLETTAILGRSFDVDDAAAMMGEPPAALLAPVQEAVAAGVLVATQDTLVFRHELVQRAIAESLPPPIRQAMHRQAGEMLLARGGVAVQAAASHFLNGARRGDAAALAGLDLAVTEVLPSSPQTAAQLATRALELTRSSDPQRGARSASAAEALLAAGHLEQAGQVVHEALEMPLGGPVQARLSCALSCLLSLAGDPARARQEAEKALAGPRLPRWVRESGRLALLRALLGLRESKQAADLAAEILLRPADERSRAVVAALVARALIMWDEGQVTEALQIARDAAGRDGWRQPDARWFEPHLFLATRLVDLHRFDDAARIMRSLVRHFGARHSIGLADALALLRARMHLAAGRLDAAAAELGAGGEPATGPRTTAAAAVLGTIALRRGELTAAGGYLQHHRPAPADPGAAYEQSWHALVSAQVQEARTDARTVADQVRPLYPLLRSHRFLLIRDPASAPWLVRVSLAAGDRRRAEFAATMADDLARGNPSVPTLAATAAHARGIADGDLPLLLAAAARHGDRWARASAAEDAGTLLASRADRELAVRRLDEALTGYHGCGATRDAARVRRRLRELGVRRRHWTAAPRPVTGWGSLTEAERATSELAAQGLTNRQIAGQMYLSAHTVAFHLRQVFRKLGIGSRVELTRLVLEHKETQEPDDGPPARQRPAWPQRPARSPTSPNTGPSRAYPRDW